MVTDLRPTYRVFHSPKIKPAPKPGTGSALVAALEEGWTAIQADHRELPMPILITGSGRKRGGLNWGHFGPDRWMDSSITGKRNEVFVGGEAMAQGGEFVMKVLLHEAAHALNRIHGEAGTSRGGQYHNALFLDRARDLDLDYLHESRCPVQGYAQVELSDAGKERWADQIKMLDEAITLHLAVPLWATGGGRRAPRSPVGGTNGLKCTCACGHIIRVSRSTYAATSGIRCDDCGVKFTYTY
jgi:hypothetical protein